MILIKNKKILTVLLATVAAVVAICFSLTGVAENYRGLASNFLYRPTGSPSKQIVIVKIDDKSINSPVLGNFDGWSRAYYAQVLRNLNKYSPKVVGFDIFFKNKKDAAGDSAFKEALADTVNPILISKFDQYQLNKQGIFVGRLGELSEGFDFFTESSNVIKSVFSAFDTNTKLGVKKVFPGLINVITKKFEDYFSFAAYKAYSGLDETNTKNLSGNSISFLDKDKNTINVPLQQYNLDINYFSKPGDLEHQYDSISFIDLYNENYLGRDPEALFKDKIVLIGPTTSILKDNFLTPISSTTLMPGVEIHANTVQTLLDRKFLLDVIGWEDYLIIFLVALTSTAIFMFSKVRWSIAYLIGFIAAYIAVSWFLFAAGFILDLINPFIALFISFIGTYIFRYFSEFKQKNEIKSAFNKYLNPTLVEEIADHPELLNLGGAKREITVIFTDIAHFTTISESLKPESLVALLNEYFEAMSEVIMSEGGTVDKFEGDAIMAFFGAPLENGNHALQACNTALKMRVKLAELLEKWKNDPPLPGGEKKPTFDFRCGVSSGEVIVGNMGSNQHLEYTVMGDVVNLGSRLEGANKKYDTKIMISEITYIKIKDNFECRELDTIKVVGKNEPSKVYELLNYKGQLVEQAMNLLKLYTEGLALYHQRNFAEALAKFDSLLRQYPDDGPSKLYRQRCEVLRDFPPPANWDGVYAMGSK